MSGGYALSPSSIAVAVTAMVVLVLGVTVLARRVTPVSSAFFSITIVVGIWMAAFTGMYAAQSARAALNWAHLAYFGVPFIAPALYWFTLELLRLERRRRLAHI